MVNWENRLQKASYTSPSGKVISFFYKDFEKTSTHKTSNTLFINKSGALIQDFGMGNLEIPIKMYILGANYDIQAKKAVDALQETGAGTLIHPLYNSILVQPISIKRVDNLSQARGLAVIEIIFMKTLGTSSLSVNSFTLGVLDDLLSSTVDDINKDFEKGFSLSSVFDRLNAIKRFAKYLENITNIFDPLVKLDSAVNSAFSTIDASISGALDNLIGKPLLLAASFQKLLQTPARLTKNISLQLQGYTSLANTIFNTNREDAYHTQNRVNQVLETVLLTRVILTASLQSSLPKGNTPLYATRDQLQNHVSNLINLYNYVLTNNTILLREVESSPILKKIFFTNPNANRKLLSMYYQGIGNLQHLSFGLATKYIVKLPHAQTLLTVIYNLHGKIDKDTVDQFTKNNHLQGKEFLYLPAGREVMYYQ